MTSAPQPLSLPTAAVNNDQTTSPTPASDETSPTMKNHLSPQKQDANGPPSKTPNLLGGNGPSPLSADPMSGARSSSTLSAQTPISSGARGLPQDMQAKMRAFHLSRQGAPPSLGRVPGIAAPDRGIRPGPPSESPSTGSLTPQTATPAGSVAAGLRLPPGARPQPPNWTSAPAVSKNAAPKPSLGARRGLKLPGGLSGSAAPDTSQPNQPNKLPTMDGSQSTNTDQNATDSAEKGSLFNKFSNFVDTKTGSLKFAGKAVIHGKGVDFSGGSSFSISLDEVDNLEELGKGNYGTVYRVRHSRPQVRRPGLGLKGNKGPPSLSTEPDSKSAPSDVEASPDQAKSPPPGKGGTTGIVMAMKEIRLELDEAKFAAIIMELDILHRCVSPFIIDFYGAFFQEGAVYICMEYMDGGSIDKLYGDGIPESVLRKVTLSTVMGLKSLKEDHNIIHRDVKPTNVLANSRGQIKICDFGVSGNLVASIAKTNIGCQSYMAPERIASGGMAQAGSGAGGTYSVQSDIWSLGLSIIECAMGRYPYPPETFNNIFSQLSAIVDGEPPALPTEGYSETAQDFVKQCLNKKPNLRPTYSTLLRHPWLAELLKPPEDAPDAEEQHTPPDTADKEVAAWVAAAQDRKRRGLGGKQQKPALHAAPLDAAASNSSNHS